MRSKKKHFNSFWFRNLCVYFALMGAFYNSLVAVVTKLLSDSLNSFEIVFFRNLIGLCIVIYVLYKNKDFDLFKDKKHWFLLFMRGFLGVSGITCFFYNIAHTDLGTANVLFKTAPMFCAFFAVILLKEKFSNKGWFGLFLGFVGFCFIAQPQLGLKTTDIVGILGGILSGLALTSVRELKKYYSSNTIVFSYMLTGTLMMIVIGILGSFDVIKSAKFVMPSPMDFVYIALIGVGSYLFQLYVTKSYVATKKTGIPAGISYSEVVFSLCFGLMLGDPIPNAYKFLGIVLIIFSGVIVALEKNRKCKVTKRAKRQMRKIKFANKMKANLQSVKV